MLFVLTMGSGMAVLYENAAFSILVLSTKKQYSAFFKKVCIFQKMCFKFKVLKHYQNLNWWPHRNMSISQMEGFFKKSLVSFFRRTYALSICSKTKPLRKKVLVCLHKIQPFIFVYLMSQSFKYLHSSV